MVALVGTSVAVVLVALGAIAVLTGGDGTALVDLEVGDCFDLPDDMASDLDEVDTVDCSEPHLAEVVALGVLNESGDEPYPGDDAALFDVVDRACRAQDAVDSPDFGLLPIAPTLALWESFEGRYLCVAIPFGGEPVTGSLVAG